MAIHDEPTHSEPCSVCGEATAIGTVLYSDRRVVDRPGGSRAYLCSICEGRIASANRGARLSQEEIASLVESGSMAAISWTRAGGM